MRRARRPGLLAVAIATWHLAAGAGDGVGHDGAPNVEYARWAQPRIASLDDLSTEALRSRTYGSRLEVIEQLGTTAGNTDYARHYARDGSPPYTTVLAEYRSDGHRVYARIDVPAAPPPPQGYPAVVFLHGWYGNDDAPGFDFSYRPDTPYADVIDAFVQAGFVVIYPGWRGYGTVRGRPAEGMAFLEAWNNASYLMPVFFAIDVLNLLDGLHTLVQTDSRRWGFASPRTVAVDPHRIHVAGHSQGGDAVLMVLAAAGEGSKLRTAIASGSIWAGCFPSRFEQLETYGPMAATPGAFLAGDGTWTGTATGRDGTVNPNFVFGWPPDWIGTVDTRSPEWTRQARQWSSPSVAHVLREKYREMYDALNRGVADLGDARFAVHGDARTRATVTHDPRVAAAMARIGGYGYPQYLREPLNLHYSDRDYYSTPAWNEDLSHRINAAGGRSRAYLYPGNTHGLGRSEHAWFSDPDVRPGFRLMLERDVALFRGDGHGATRPGE